MNLLAETCYTHDGPHWFLAFPLLLLLLLFVFGPWRRRRWHRPSGESVLGERYARGEIDEDEYRARRQVLRGK